MSISAESGTTYRPQFYKVGLLPFPRSDNNFSSPSVRAAVRRLSPVVALPSLVARSRDSIEEMSQLDSLRTLAEGEISDEPAALLPGETELHLAARGLTGLLVTTSRMSSSSCKAAIASSMRVRGKIVLRRQRRKTYTVRRPCGIV